MEGKFDEIGDMKNGKILKYSKTYLDFDYYVICDLWIFLKNHDPQKHLK